MYLTCFPHSIGSRSCSKVEQCGGPSREANTGSCHGNFHSSQWGLVPSQVAVVGTTEAFEYSEEGITKGTIKYGQLK